MANIYEDVKREWPLVEIYVEDCLYSISEFQPSVKHEIKPIVPLPFKESSIKDDPHSQSQNQGYQEMFLGKGSDFLVAEEDVEVFVKEEVALSPICFDEPASNSSSIEPTCFNKNLSIETEPVGRKSVKPREKTHECFHCSKKFSQKGHLRDHILTHTGEKSHECPHCSKKFRLKKTLRQHNLTHTGEKAHDCPLCCMKFSQKGNLRKHILTHAE